MNSEYERIKARIEEDYQKKLQALNTIYPEQISIDKSHVDLNYELIPSKTTKVREYQSKKIKRAKPQMKVRDLRNLIVGFVNANIGNEFSTREVTEKLCKKYPDVVINSHSVSSCLCEMASSGNIEKLKTGDGFGGCNVYLAKRPNKTLFDFANSEQEVQEKPKKSIAKIRKKRRIPSGKKKVVDLVGKVKLAFETNPDLLFTHKNLAKYLRNEYPKEYINKQSMGFYFKKFIDESFIEKFRDNGSVFYKKNVNQQAKSQSIQNTEDQIDELLS